MEPDNWSWKVDAVVVSIGKFLYKILKALAVLALGLILILVAVEVWPSGFFDIPLSQMTFGRLFQFCASIALFVLGIVLTIAAFSIPFRQPGIDC